MRGASALGGLLGEFPDVPIQVRVVWEPVLKTDIAPPLDGGLGLLPDKRVAQYWDPARMLSADLVRSVNEDPQRYGREDRLPPGFVSWDVVAVFGLSALWGRDLPSPVQYGGPVVREIGRVRTAILDMENGSDSKVP